MILNHHKSYNRELHQWLLKVFEFSSKIDKSSLRHRACPVCRSRKSFLFLNNDYLDYHKCKKCSLLFMNPALPGEKLNAGFKGADAIVRDYFRIMKKYSRTVPARPQPGKDNKLADIFRIK